jgi:pimeloyl-ACP methyl ester carboxylesterase
MKSVRLIFRYAIILFVFAKFLTSCKKDNSSSDYSYLVSKEFIISYNTGYITDLLNIAAGTYSGINVLKPYVSSDVNIYKVIYRTTINNEKINASGLICVPSTSGEYPILCFQNGINTVHAYAPTEYVLNPPYQMIEIVASMGYIVVIPDYPGFGESVQVSHPYLITEPTVTSITDMLYAVKELGGNELPGITLRNEYYLLGYSQGGWATLTLHKALELDYPDDFLLKGSACGAGPYNLNILLQGMINVSSYPMPVYIGYLINAYKAYNQFSNPVSDIIAEPYSSRLSSLFSGTLTSSQINEQLTTSIPDLFTEEFLSGFTSESKYAPVREALTSNSVAAWNTAIPLFFVHGANDSYVNPVITENMYNAMIQAGTSSQTCKKEIVPDLDHGKGVLPCMVRSLIFLMNLSNP